MSSATGRCNPCDIGFYKNTDSNEDACMPCPENYTTFTTGAALLSSCVLVQPPPDTDVSPELPSNTSTGTSNSSVVSALQLNMSVAGITDVACLPTLVGFSALSSSYFRTPHNPTSLYAKTQLGWGVGG